MEGKCLLFEQDGTVSLGRLYLPGLGASEVLIETALSCISPGTELRVLAGRQPGLPAKYYPLIPGYALVGTVVACGAAVSSVRVGETVVGSGTKHSNHRLGWGGHVSHAIANADEVVAVPPSVDLRDAVLCRMAAVAWRGLRMAAPVSGDAVAVLGLGLIGQLAARLYAQAGATVVAGGISARQVELAAAAGIRAVEVDRSSVKRLQKLAPEGCAIVVDATGNPAALPLAVELAAPKAWNDASLSRTRLVVQGSYDGEIAFPHYEAFARELTVLWPRNCHREDVAAVLNLVATGAVSFRDLMTHILSPESAADTYQLLRARHREVLTAAFQWTIADGASQPDAGTAATPVRQETSKGWTAWFRR